MSDLQSRSTQIETETRLSRFYFEAPFTLSGAARGEIGEQ
jgi:hypothetical protein